MKKYFILLALIVLILTACSPETELGEVIATPENPAAVDPEESFTTTPQALTVEFLNTDFEDAASIRNQLSYGILLLEETDFAVTQEQASSLLPLFQASLALTNDVNSVSDEINAVQNQIIDNMTQAQLEKIAELRITNTLLNEFYLENGVVMTNQDPSSTRVPGSGAGMGRNLDQASREATRTAMGGEVGTGEGQQGAGQQGRTLLFDKVIALLTERVGE